MQDYYDIIFKRKSVRKFDGALVLSDGDMSDIKDEIERFSPLQKDIDVRFNIVKREQTTARFGSNCLLMYSEKKPLYLLNAGYMLEQMDLFMASKNIGVCWYGLGKTKEKTFDGLDYVIMLAFGKSAEGDFRKNPDELNRKNTQDIWHGEFDSDVKLAVRAAPSACNSQPWKIESADGKITVSRDTKVRSIIPRSMLSYFNSIDMGICLDFLETALDHKGYKFERTLEVLEDGEKPRGLEKIAEYIVAK